MTSTTADRGAKCERGKNQCGKNIVPGSTTVAEASSALDMCCYFVKNIEEPKPATDKITISGIEYTYA